MVVVVGGTAQAGGREVAMDLRIVLSAIRRRRRAVFALVARCCKTGGWNLSQAHPRQTGCMTHAYRPWRISTVQLCT